MRSQLVFGQSVGPCCKPVLPPLARDSVSSPGRLAALALYLGTYLNATWRRRHAESFYSTDRADYMLARLE